MILLIIYLFLFINLFPYFYSYKQQHINIIKNLFLEFGRKFLTNSPDATTGLLVKLCTGDYQSIISLPFLINDNKKNNIGVKENNENNKSKEKIKDKNKNIENLKLSSNLIKKIALPLDDIISFFSGYEDRLFQLVVAVGNALGSKASITIGNTTLELYLDRLYLLRTYDENITLINENNSVKNANNKSDNNNDEKKIDDEILKSNFLLEKNKNINSIEEKILIFLDGDLPYDRYVKN